MSSVLYSIVFCVVILLITPCFSLYSLDKNNIEDKFKVKVSVSLVDDESLKQLEGTRTLIESYVKRELRSLNDVVVVGDNPRFVIKIMILPVTKAEPRLNPSHWILSTIFLEQVIDDTLVKKYFKDEYQDVGLGMSKLYLYYNSALSFVNLEKLSSVCRSIVANFDTDLLEGYRELETQKYKSVAPEKPTPTACP